MLTTGHEPTWLGDHLVLANTIRVFIIVVGFSLAMVVVKVAYQLAREREWDRMFGALSFACFATSPSLIGLYRFDQPLQAFPTLAYLLGLTLGVVAMAFRFTIAWSWLGFLRGRNAKDPHAR